MRIWGLFLLILGHNFRNGKPITLSITKFKKIPIRYMHVRDVDLQNLGSRILKKPRQKINEGICAEKIHFREMSRDVSVMNRGK